MSQTEEILSLTERWSAHNYDPLPVVLDRGEGCWVRDVDGNRYLDMLSSYSALNQGHGHPRIREALEEQARQLSLTSRAFHNDQMGPFLRELCEATGFDRALPMNTGAEAVETAIKAARKWGMEKKGVEDGRQEIIVCENNFHGRTTTIVSFSTEAINENTVGFMVEPIQGEGGVVVPPEGYLARCAEICREHDVLLLNDEIQTGLGRTGRLFCGDWDGVRGDILIVGKALGGGVAPDPGERMRIEKAIASLPDRARTAIVLHGIEGYAYEEVAELMGVAVGTVKSHIHRARRLLLERLEER